MTRRWRILAVDPGNTTGIAVVDMAYPAVLETHEFDYEDVADFMFNPIDRGAIDEIVCEHFYVDAETLKKTWQADTFDVIGIMRYTAYILSIPYTHQPPSSVKKLATNDRLIKIGWWTPGQGHAQDATRHLFYRCVTSGLIGFEADDTPVFR